MSRSLRISFAVLAMLAACGDSPSGLDKANRVLRDDARFVTSGEASRALNETAALVLADARSCAKKRSAEDRRCVGRFQLAAYYQAESIEITACDRDGRRTLRAAALTALARVEKNDVTAPGLNRCPH